MSPGLDQSHLEEPWENYGGNNNIGHSEKWIYLWRGKKNARELWDNLRWSLYYISRAKRVKT